MTERPPLNAQTPAEGQVVDLMAALERSVKEARAGRRSPRERWGTCCPFDPECDHSYIEDADDLTRWMDTPISDEHARILEHG